MVAPEGGLAPAPRAVSHATAPSSADDSLEAFRPYDGSMQPPADSATAGSAAAAIAPAVAEEAPVEPDRAEPVARELPPAPAPAPVTPGARVLASYFGPGLFGRTTACGHVLTTSLVGVADRTLPCGTPVTLQYGGAVVTVPVIDRGPYVYTRQFDLTYATKLALGCPDVCSLTWLR